VIPPELLALVRGAEFAFLAPLCLAVALVTSAAHREDVGEILRHAARAWVVTVVGILAFLVAMTLLVEWIQP
jgi:hypothetical protein